MKRTIKFKALRTDGQGWVVGDLIHVTKGFKPSVQIIVWSKEPFDFEVIPETVCEFTGEQDKNGVDVYENDKLRSINHYEGKKPIYNIHVIQWRQRLTGWFAKNVHNLDKEDTNGDCQLWVYAKNLDFEIIGNIHSKN